MVLPRDYQGQRCSIARTLEVVGERWSLLVVRDAFFGVRRFSDFVRHLGIPRAVLTERLDRLVEEGVLERVPGPGRRTEYALTPKGVELWPVLRAMAVWGDEHYSPAGPRRLSVHAGCGGAVDSTGACARCRHPVPVTETVTTPGPGYEPPPPGADAVTLALTGSRTLLEPLP